MIHTPCFSSCGVGQPAVLDPQKKADWRDHPLRICEEFPGFQALHQPWRVLFLESTELVDHDASSLWFKMACKRSWLKMTNAMFHLAREWELFDP